LVVNLKYLLVFLIISLPFVTYPGSVIKNNLSIFVKAIVFFYFTYLIVDTPKRLKIFLVTFVACQVFRVLEPLYLNVMYGYWGASTYMGGTNFASRLSGAPSDVINPNELGFVIATIIPFLHYLLLPRGGMAKLVYLMITPLLLYALILTMSRGAFLALLVVGYLIFKESNKKLFLIMVVIGMGFAGWANMTDVQKDRYLSLVSDESESSASVDGRLRGIQREFSLGLERPIFGHGLGTTSEAKFHKMGKPQASHSLYAELLIEIGFVGMVVFLAFLRRIYLEIDVVRKSGCSEYVEYQRIIKVLVCVFFMYAVYSINYWGLSQYYWYLFGGLVAVVARFANSYTEEDLYGSKK
ncbi:hypothetical protein A3715_07930, partial [Oleiphilus sp. HI0009]